jgi:hypothetical protein
VQGAWALVVLSGLAPNPGGQPVDRWHKRQGMHQLLVRSRGVQHALAHCACSFQCTSFICCAATVSRHLWLLSTAHRICWLLSTAHRICWHPLMLSQGCVGSAGTPHAHHQGCSSFSGRACKAAGSQSAPDLVDILKNTQVLDSAGARGPAAAAALELLLVSQHAEHWCSKPQPAPAGLCAEVHR